MDPQLLETARWELIGVALRHLVLFVAFMVAMALSFLLAHGIIPSLIINDEAPPETARFRPLFYFTSAVAMTMMFFNLGRAIFIAIPILQYFYPRFAI
jgi:hypothetical protein